VSAVNEDADKELQHQVSGNGAGGYCQGKGEAHDPGADASALVKEVRRILAKVEDGGRSILSRK
jgi:hypothetical protein